jgi:RNA polymerase sigma factor (sigma-70 family)
VTSESLFPGSLPRFSGARHLDDMEHIRTWKSEELLQHHRWARSLARRLVADDATADDVAQESMIIALERAPREPHGGGGLRSWLGAVVRNVARQRGRSEGRRAHREREAASPEPLPSALEMTAFAEGQKLLLSALLTLDEESRHMVLLRYQEGLPAAEIARRLGKNSGTVRSKIKRALEGLRVELDQTHGGDRRAWHAAVAPLTLGLPVRGAAVAAAGGTGVAAGRRYAFWKYAAGLGAAAAVVMGLVSVLSPGTFFDDRKEPPGVLLASAEDALSEVDLNLAPGEESTVAAAPSAAPERQAVHMVEDIEPEPAAEPSEAKTGRIRLRLVDEEARPIAGVEVSARGGKPARSAADGRVEIEVFLGLESAEASLQLVHRGHAADVVAVRGTRGKTIDAGDHVLIPGGDVTGRVVNAEGNPMAGMVVSTSGRERRVSAGGGMSSYTSTPLGRTEATTGSDGAFELHGVLAGEVDVLVESENEIWTGSAESVDVRAGAVVRDLVIVAEEVPLGTRIEGVVLDHTGQPAPYARIRMKWSKFFSNGSQTTTADAVGRFAEIVPSGVSADMWFRGRGDSLPRAFQEGVDAGTIGMVVRLAEPRTLTVLVTEDRGQSLANAEVWVTAGNSSSDAGTTDAEGRVDLSRPLAEFTLLVRAEGYAESLEDYRELAPERSEAMALPVQLVSIPRLEGVVRTTGGKAVEGAALSVRSLAKQKTKIAGLPSLVENYVEASGSADSDGRFALTVREDGEFMLRAEAKGYAPTELGPFRYEPADGLAEVKLTMSKGGSIEGRVIDGDLVRQQHVVMLSRGDGLVTTVHTSLDGDYRFEHVTPGPCFLRVVPEMIPSGQGDSMSTWGKAYTRIEGDVLVTEGAVSRFDLVIGKGLPPVTLKGRLDLTGFDPARFRASLMPAMSGLGGVDSQPMRVGSDGAFRLRGGKPGRYNLVLVDGDAESETEALRIAASIDLAVGTNDWTLSAGFGRIVTGPGAAPSVESLLWRGPSGEYAIRPLPAVGEACEFPAGTVYRVPLVALMQAGEFLDLDRVDALGSVELAAGGQAVLGQ